MNDSVYLNIGNRTIQVWKNPAGDLGLLPSLIRFTADDQTRTIYMWGFNEAYHSDISIGLSLTCLLYTSEAETVQTLDEVFSI